LAVGCRELSVFKKFACGRFIRVQHYKEHAHTSFS
jgi:hypothetical protein